MQWPIKHLLGIKMPVISNHVMNWLLTADPCLLWAAFMQILGVMSPASSHYIPGMTRTFPCNYQVCSHYFYWEHGTSTFSKWCTPWHDNYQDSCNGEVCHDGSVKSVNSFLKPFQSSLCQCLTCGSKYEPKSAAKSYVIKDYIPIFCQISSHRHGVSLNLKELY